jgi:hypothetical protein
MKMRIAIPCLLALLVGPFLAAGAAVPQPDSVAPAAMPAGPAQPHQAYTWQISRVDAPHEFEELGSRSLVLDAAARPHIVYGADFLYHAWHDGATWHVEIVDDSGDVVRYTSLAMDAAGRLHISYRAGFYSDLKYARYDGAAWHVEVVASGGYGPTSLALDGLGQPHIAYAGGQDSLRYAVYDGTVWHVETVESVNCGDLSLALDPPGFAHIAYNAYTESALKYAHEDAAGWHVETLDSNEEYFGFTPSLVVDDSGRPHIAYYNEELGELDYARVDGSFWHIQPVPTSGGREPSLLLDADDHPGIAFTGGVSMRYARHDGVLWHVEPFDGYGQEASLALDAAGRPHVSHRRGPFLKYSYDDGAAWHTETVDTAAHDELYSAITLDDRGRPHVSYLRHYEGSPPPQYWDLNVAYYDGAAWPSETVATGREGARNALALDAAGHAHVAWASCDYGLGDCDLLHAYYDGTAWQVTTVDGAGDVGAGNSLSLDAAGYDHISYADWTSGTLKYAQYDGATWQIAVVDSAGYYGTTSLALDAAGRPHISYYSSTGLRYAYNDNTGWQIQTLDTTEYAGACNSLALDAAGRPHIAYTTGQYDPVLHYAWYDGATWQKEVILSGTSGGSPALALDAAGRPHIAYHNWTTGNLDYAWHNGVDWYAEMVDGTGDDMDWRSCSPALALDAAGRPHISYYDRTHRDIKYAYGIPQCVPVTGAQVEGPGLLPLGIAGRFTATAGPISATLPFTYTWDNGRVDPTATYTWSTTGTHTLEVTVSNGCGQGTGAHTVTVFCQPLQGVTVAGPGTLLVGQVGTYEATAQPITASRPITWTWDHGLTGPTASYSWTTTGTCTVAVTVTNPCGQGPTAGQSVRVIAAWPHAVYLGLVIANK